MESLYKVKSEVAGSSHYGESAQMYVNRTKWDVLYLTTDVGNKAVQV